MQSDNKSAVSEMRSPHVKLEQNSKQNDRFHCFEFLLNNFIFTMKVVLNKFSNEKIDKHELNMSNFLFKP